VKILGRQVPAAIVALGLLTATEWVAAARAYRTTIVPRDWERARTIVSAEPDRWVTVGTPWLDPSIRSEIPMAADPQALGRPDLRGAPERWTVWSAGDPDAPDAGGEIRERLEVGGLVLTRHAASRERMLDRLEHDSLKVRGPQGTCRKRRAAFDCRPGRVVPAFVEVDYEARRCLSISGIDGSSVTLERTMTLGDTLIGHVGFGDFNARLRSDAPVRIELSIDGTPYLRTVVTDEQGWWPFEVETEPGPARVELRVLPALGGRFNARGDYGPTPSRATCVELRSLAGSRESAP
jgi:hypothetical protein